MRRYGLIGYPLSHSKSKVFFDEFFSSRAMSDCTYNNYALETEQEVTRFIKTEEGLCGLNITSPYKRLAFELCDEVSEEAEQTRSVNCIHFRYGRLHGYNTDVYGFVKAIEPLLDKENEVNALILGTGGAASAAFFGLTSLGIRSQMVGRMGNSFFPRGYSDLAKNNLSLYHLIINCTPLGTWPNIDECPSIPYEDLQSEQILFDMVYNPEVTTFMRHGIAAGCRVKNGSEMLRFQALRAWEIWQGDSGNHLSENAQ